MRTSTKIPCLSTRMAPFGVMASSRWALALLAGSTFITGSAVAVENFWLGTTPDWNTASNWSLGRVPTNANGAIPPAETFDDAMVNTATPNPATISADIPTPRDIIVGRGATANGQVNHTAGIAATGEGNWMFVGQDGGRGVYNLANTAATGGTLTGFGQGSGNLTVSGRFNVGLAGSTGTINVNTSGALTVNAGGADAFKIGEGTAGNGTLNLDGGTISIPNGEMWVGQGAGSTGVMSMSAGTVNVNNWAVIGRAGGNGTFNISGGTFNKAGGGNFIVGDNSIGNMTQTGGAVSVNGEMWVGQGGGSTNSNFVMSAGTVAVNSWVAIGRGGGTGNVNMSGGTFTKTGATSNFIVGASGPGTMIQSGGLTDVQEGLTWVGEADGTTGTLTLSGTAEFRSGIMEMGANGGSTGNLVLNGGTLRTGQIRGGNGTANVTFNGTQIIATADQAAFINNLDAATIGAGNLLIDTNSFSVGVTQALGGAGAIVKTGQGTAALGGGNSYLGGTTVTGGTLLINGSQTLATGVVTVGTGATVGGNGTSGGNLSVTAGGSLAPGNNGAGTLTSTGSAAFDPLSSLNYQLLGTDTTPGGANNDLLAGVTGSLVLDGILNITEGAAGSFQTSSFGDQWRLIDYTGTLTDNGLSLGSTPALSPGLNFEINTATAGQVNLVVVPEPTTTGILGAVLGALALRRRRK